MDKIKNLGNASEKHESRSEKLQQAKEFSLFTVNFEWPPYPREKVNKMAHDDNAHNQMYGLYDTFTEECFLKGLELNDPFFVGEVIDTFMETHQSGLSLKDYIGLKNKEVIDFFEQHGRWFIENLGSGAETEQYKHWNCKMKSE